MARGFHSFLILLSCLSAVNAAVICMVCDQSDPNCKYTPTHKQRCPRKSDGCFEVYHNDNSLTRGCATPDSPQWQECISSFMQHCFHCRYNLCNSLPMRIKRSIACVVSKQRPIDTPNLMPTECEGEIPPGTIDFCYMLMDKWTDNKYHIVDRGCFPFVRTGNVGNTGLFYCSEDSCNMYGRQNNLECVDGPRSASAVGEPKAVSCATANTADWFPIMCARYHGSDQLYDGCLTHLPNVEAVRHCVTDVAGPRKCQTCVGTACNWSVDRSRWAELSKCRDMQNRLNICSMLKAKCFVHVRNDKAVQAGCVEPTTPMDILSHQKTYFCQTNIPDHYDGCLSPLDSYEGRLACYRCHEEGTHKMCNYPATLHTKQKDTCNSTAKFCVARVMGRRIYRGCDNEPLIISVCQANPGQCLYCNTNYCNGLPMQDNNAKCYSTRTHVAGVHSSRLVLKKCEARVAFYSEQPCYIARKANSPLIQAGCVEDSGVWQGSYKVKLTGGTGIIFEEKFYCYKCVSSSPFSCFSVRHQEPQLCKGNAESAFRGCYTLFDQKYQRIQRGCLSELDEYRLGVCLTVGYEEMCITCNINYCNIHLPNDEDG